MMTRLLLISAASAVALWGGALLGEELASKATEEPVLGPATLHCVGIHWIIGGDENANAEVRLSWRPPGGAWKEAQPLLRVEKGAQNPEKGHGSVAVPAKAWLFAGSLLRLNPASEYEVKLALTDADGGGREVVLKTRTAEEPVAPEDATVFHVQPGTGGGAGSKTDPFRGL